MFAAACLFTSLLAGLLLSPDSSFDARRASFKGPPKELGPRHLWLEVAPERRKRRSVFLGSLPNPGPHDMRRFLLLSEQNAGFMGVQKEDYQQGIPTQNKAKTHRCPFG